ncbi:MAG: hypothetical protein R2824_05940 [Saprospiraceae bacterium]|nr:hypothetical protein [Lewinella sp.]
MQFTERIKQRLNQIRQFKMREDQAILLSCFGIALVFWVLVKLSQEYTSAKPVSFSYTMPDDLALANLPPEDVTATLKGTGWNLMFEYLAGSSIPVHFEIEATGEFRLNRAQMRGEILGALASKELDITEINYDEIDLSVEPKESKRVPIRHQVNLELAPEHHLSAPILLEPDSVTMTGAVSEVRSYDSWPTDSIYLEGLSKSLLMEVLLKPPPPQLQLDVLRTNMTLSVESYTEKSLFIPVSLKNAPADSLKVFPDKIKISFVVGLSRYDSVHYTDFKLEADLKAASLEKGKNTVPVRLVKAPGSVKNVLLSRNSVEFFILKPNEAVK